MQLNRILNIHKPALLSFVTNQYQKVYVDFIRENYYYNQFEEMWDIHVKDEERNHVIDTYKNENRSFSSEDYKNLFLSKINSQVFIDKTDVLEKIYQDASKVYTVLTKFDKIGISYCLSIAGGAVRDFVNEKPIKDIDMILSIPDTFENKNILRKLNDISFLKNNFEMESVIHYLQNCYTQSTVEDDFIEKKKQLLSLCFQDLIVKNINLHENHALLNVKVYTDNVLKQNSLIDVLPLAQDKMQLNYPVDILLTELDIDKVIKVFDFDLCKASFNMVHNDYNNQFPSNYSSLISRFVADRDFWADIYNKKLTINVGNMNHQYIESSMIQHFKRLQEKYPDYSINIISGGNEDNLKYARYVYLENKESLQPKGFSEKRLKL